MPWSWSLSLPYAEPYAEAMNSVHSEKNTLPLPFLRLSRVGASLTVISSGIGLSTRQVKTQNC